MQKGCTVVRNFGAPTIFLETENCEIYSRISNTIQYRKWFDFANTYVRMT